MGKKLTTVLYICLTIALLAGSTWGIHALRKREAHGLFVVGKAPSFCFTDQHNQPFCDRDFKGKIWVADFFFTSCPTICPVMTTHMVAVQNAFPDNAIGIASFSIDPETDTPEVLQAYAQEKGVRSPHWHLLTGKEEDIYRTANEGFNIYAKAGNTPENFEHSGLFALVDTKGNIVCRKENGKPIFFYDGMTQEGIAMLIEDIRKLMTNDE
ncbi:MAG: SCO family protein [Capnocytophaga granulosa]